jgi:hypothetical protein
LPKFPEPPDLRRIDPIWHAVPAGTLLWRLYRQGGPHPARWDEFRRFGPVQTARFDHHQPPPRVQDRGILYLATYGPTPLGEAFQDTHTIDLWEHEPWLVGFETAAELRLLDLTGSWPTRAGASMVLSSGRRDRARRWSQAIFDAYVDAAGLWYPSSMDANRPCVALYERGEFAVPTHPRFHAALGDPKLTVVVHRAAARFNYRVVGASWRP